MLAGVAGRVAGSGGRGLVSGVWRWAWGPVDRARALGALDTALVEKRRDGGEYEGEQRERNNDGNAEPRRDAHIVQSRSQFLELCD